MVMSLCESLVICVNSVCVLFSLAHICSRIVYLSFGATLSRFYLEANPHLKRDVSLGCVSLGC